MANKSIDDDHLVTAHLYGDTVEISTAVGGNPVMRRYDKDHMVNVKTGEIKKVHHITSRADPKNYESLRATFKKLKRLIGANFGDFLPLRSQLWLTLTYRESPMTDGARLYDDFKRFMRKLRKITGKYLAYIVVIEPQASGSLHAHLLLKTLDGSRLYLPNSVVAKAWGQGFVNVRRLRDGDNVSAYLMAYLTDVDLNNLEGETNTKEEKKSIVKGGRLGLYPIGLQIYRRSKKGIRKPEKLRGKKQEIMGKTKLFNSEPDYYKKFDMMRSDEPFEIEVEFYSRKKARLKQAMDKINKNN